MQLFFNSSEKKATFIFFNNAQSYMNFNLTYPKIGQDIIACIEQEIQPLLGTQEAWNPSISRGGRKTTYIDTVAEEAAIIYLEKMNVPYQLVTEESTSLGEGELTIILDPLDGTNNALLGIPFYSVSVAIWGEKKYGLVKNLVTQETYEAFSDGPSLKDGVPIHPDCPLSISTGYVGKGYERVLPLSHSWRCYGSLALELCYVAEGKFQSLVDLRKKARVVDVAGAQIIAESAGLKVTDERGISPFDCGFFDESGNFAGNIIIAALPEFHEEILEALKE
jgi:myo-inositol-1(or 4)-monophosphatase